MAANNGETANSNQAEAIQNTFTDVKKEAPALDLYATLMNTQELGSSENIKIKREPSDQATKQSDDGNLPTSPKSQINTQTTDFTCNFCGKVGFISPKRRRTRSRVIIENMCQTCTEKREEADRKKYSEDVEIFLEDFADVKNEAVAVSGEKLATSGPKTPERVKCPDNAFKNPEVSVECSDKSNEERPPSLSARKKAAKRSFMSDRRKLAFECEFCDNTFPRRWDCDLHVLHDHYDVPPFEYLGPAKGVYGPIETTGKTNYPARCPICKETFPVAYNIVDHIKVKHLKLDNKRFECEICGKKLTQAKWLKKHMQIHEKGHSVHRDYCMKCTNGLIEVFASLEASKTKATVFFQCEIHQSELTRNRKQLGGHCLLCSAISTDASTVGQLNDKIEHDASWKSRIRILVVGTRQCPECDYDIDKSKYNRPVEQHVVRHKWLHLYACMPCRKIFHIKPHLEKHMISTAHTLSYPCECCDRDFRSSYLRDQHIIEDHYKKTIEFIDDGKKHYKSARPANCPFCNKKIGRMKSLVAHARSMHFEFFNCMTCSQRFVIEDDLHDHATVCEGESSSSKKVPT